VFKAGSFALQRLAWNNKTEQLWLILLLVSISKVEAG